jgi:hypothetical protein
MSNMPNFGARLIQEQRKKVLENLIVARDIVRFMRDDATARHNQSALLMYLERRISECIPPLERIEVAAADIERYDPDEPEDLPF